MVKQIWFLYIVISSEDIPLFQLVTRYTQESFDLMAVRNPIFNRVLYNFKINKSACSQTNYNLFLYELSKNLVFFSRLPTKTIRKFQFGITNQASETLWLSTRCQCLTDACRLRSSSQNACFSFFNFAIYESHILYYGHIF